MLSVLSLRDIFDWAWGWYSLRKHRLAIEQHLEEEKRKGGDRGRRTIGHLQRHLSLSEDEIWKAVRSSRRIQVLSTKDDKGRVDGHYFEII